jgi:hypothetical protein
MVPRCRFRVLDQAELDRVRAVVIDTVAVEQVGVGEGVTCRAVRAVDAYQRCPQSAQLIDLQLGSCLGISAGYDPPSRAAAVF